MTKEDQTNPECRPCKRCCGTGRLRESADLDSPNTTYQCPDCNGDLAPQNMPNPDVTYPPSVEDSLGRVLWTALNNHKATDGPIWEQCAAAVEAEALRRKEPFSRGHCVICNSTIWSNEQSFWDKSLGDEKLRHFTCHLKLQRDQAKSQETGLRAIIERLGKENERLKNNWTYDEKMTQAILQRDELEREVERLRSSNIELHEQNERLLKHCDGLDEKCTEHVHEIQRLKSQLPEKMKAETMKAPLPAGVPDTPEIREALQRACEIDWTTIEISTVITEGAEYSDYLEILIEVPPGMNNQNCSPLKSE